jgi:molybdopterin synthase catalytic subunit
MYSIVEQPIDVGDLLGSAKDDSAGAVLLFLGTVRDHNEGTQIVGIYYEAYVKMAEQTLSSIEKETLDRWELRKLAMVHRVGELAVGDISVAVAVSSEHRNEAFEAGRYAIDKIKAEVPIWKKEKTSAGQEFWVKGTSLSGEAY